MRQLRPARKPAVARVKAGTHDYLPPVPDLLPILVSPPLSASRRDTNTSSGQSDILFLLGGCFQVQYCTSGHVTSRHVTYNVTAVLLLPFYDRRKQLSRSQYGRVHQYNMETARQVGVLQYFAVQHFST